MPVAPCAGRPRPREAWPRAAGCHQHREPQPEWAHHSTGNAPFPAPVLPPALLDPNALCLAPKQDPHPQLLWSQSGQSLPLSPDTAQLQQELPEGTERGTKGAGGDHSSVSLSDVAICHPHLNPFNPALKTKPAFCFQALAGGAWEQPSAGDTENDAAESCSPHLVHIQSSFHPTIPHWWEGKQAHDSTRTHPPVWQSPGWMDLNVEAPGAL